MTKVKLLRPLDGRAEGSIVDYPEKDAERLKRRGAVEAVGEKAAPAPLNKKAPDPDNKSASGASTKAI